jgi:predicted RNA binding protein YcfA (HicA-like mRNA interferase family)
MTSVRKLLRFLKKQGYRVARQSGSHIILEHPERKMLVIPNHPGALPKGLFLRILKDAGFTLEDFRRH